MEQNGDNKLMIHGILLQETSVSRGEFIRIGAFSFAQNYGENNEDYIAFINIIEEIGSSMVETVCAEFVTNNEHPKEQYVVTVI